MVKNKSIKNKKKTYFTKNKKNYGRKNKYNNKKKGGSKKNKMKKISRRKIKKYKLKGGNLEYKSAPTKSQKKLHASLHKNYYDFFNISNEGRTIDKYKQLKIKRIPNTPKYLLGFSILPTDPYKYIYVYVYEVNDEDQSNTQLGEVIKLDFKEDFFITNFEPTLGIFSCLFPTKSLKNYKTNNKFTYKDKSYKDIGNWTFTVVTKINHTNPGTKPDFNFIIEYLLNSRTDSETVGIMKLTNTTYVNLNKDVFFNSKVDIITKSTNQKITEITDILPESESASAEPPIRHYTTVTNQKTPINESYNFEKDDFDFEFGFGENFSTEDSSENTTTGHNQPTPSVPPVNDNQETYNYLAEGSIVIPFSFYLLSKKYTQKQIYKQLSLSKTGTGTYYIRESRSFHNAFVIDIKCSDEKLFKVLFLVITNNQVKNNNQLCPGNEKGEPLDNHKVFANFNALVEYYKQYELINNTKLSNELSF